MAVRTSHGFNQKNHKQVIFRICENEIPASQPATGDFRVGATTENL